MLQPLFSQESSRILSLNKTLGKTRIYTNRFSKQKRSPHPLVVRPGGRPTPSTGRPVGRPGAQQRVGTFSRSTGRSTELQPRACCARRSTGPVDRTSDTAGGRPGRSTGTSDSCCCCCFRLLFPSSFRHRLPRRSLDDPSTIHVNFLSNTSLFSTILHLGEDSQI